MRVNEMRPRANTLNFLSYKMHLTEGGEDDDEEEEGLALFILISKF